MSTSFGSCRTFVSCSKLSTEVHVIRVDHYIDEDKWTGCWTSCPSEYNNLLVLHRRLAHLSDLWTKLVEVTFLLVKLDGKKYCIINCNCKFEILVKSHLNWMGYVWYPCYQCCIWWFSINTFCYNYWHFLCCMQS